MRISDWSSDVCSSDLEARDPAIAEVLVIEGIEDARPAEARKAENSERADVKVTETRLQPPDPRCVGKDTVQLPWRLGSDHRMVAVGYGAMQKPQRRIIVPPPDIGQAARQHSCDERRVRKECVQTCRHR